MLQQRLAAELGQDVDGIDARVDEVAEDEIDDAVLAAERNGRFGPFLGQRIQPRPFPPASTIPNTRIRIDRLSARGFERAAFSFQINRKPSGWKRKTRGGKTGRRPMPETRKSAAAYMYSGIRMPRMPAVRSSCRRKKSVIHSRNTFFSRFSSWMMGYWW